MKSLIPVILVIIFLAGAITFALSKRAIPKEAETRFGIAANELETGTIDNASDKANKIAFNVITPSPSLTPLVTPTPTAVITPVVINSEITSLPSAGQKGGEDAVEPTAPKATKQITKTTKTVVCTPVYGQANTCTEHVVVDTGAADAIFFNFAGLSYLAGLVAFIKAKYA